MQHYERAREVTIVDRKAPSQLPNSLNRGELRTVGRQEQQVQLCGMASQERGREDGVIVANIPLHEGYRWICCSVRLGDAQSYTGFA